MPLSVVTEFTDLFWCFELDRSQIPGQRLRLDCITRMFQMAQSNSRPARQLKSKQLAFAAYRHMRFDESEMGSINNAFLCTQHMADAYCHIFPLRAE